MDQAIVVQLIKDVDVRSTNSAKISRALWPVRFSGWDRSCLSWFYCCKSGTFGARSNGGGATFPPAVNGNWMRTSAANIATELSLHSPPCSQMISFGTRTIQQGTRALPE